MNMGDAMIGTGQPIAGQPSLAEEIVQAYGAFQAVQMQNKLASINLQRAQAGQAPIQLTQIPGAVPTVNVQADITPETKSQLMTAGLIVGGIAVAFLVIKALK